MLFALNSQECHQKLNSVKHLSEFISVLYGNIVVFEPKYTSKAPKGKSHKLSISVCINKNLPSSTQSFLEMLYEFLNWNISVI